MTNKSSEQQENTESELERPGVQNLEQAVVTIKTVTKEEMKSYLQLRTKMKTLQN